MSLSFIELCSVISSLEDLKETCGDKDMNEHIVKVIRYARELADLPSTEFGPEPRDKFLNFNPIPRGW
jgi:hypothetical protein